METLLNEQMCDLKLKRDPLTFCYVLIFKNINLFASDMLELTSENGVGGEVLSVIASHPRRLRFNPSQHRRYILKHSISDLPSFGRKVSSLVPGP